MMYETSYYYPDLYAMHRIYQAGGFGKLVVDGAVMENYWDRSKPLPTKGSIMLHPGGRADVPTLRQFVGGAGPAQTVSESADVRQATGRGSRAVGFRLAYQAAFKG